MAVRILIADDHSLVRQTLREILELNGFAVVAEAGNGRTAVKMALELLPDIVVMDICMPECGGIEATRSIIANAPQIRVIAVSACTEREYAEAMLEAGACGYVLKDCAFEDLPAAVDEVLDGRGFLSRRLAGTVAAH